MSRRSRMFVTCRCQPCQHAGGCLKEWLTGTVGGGVAWCLTPERELNITHEELACEEGPLCSCCLLPVIDSSCCCSKDQHMLLPDACSEEVSMAKGCQAGQLAKPPPLQSVVPHVGSAPGCRAVYSKYLPVVGETSHLTASCFCRQIHVQS